KEALKKRSTGPKIHLAVEEGTTVIWNYVMRTNRVDDAAMVAVLLQEVPDEIKKG
ncbi:MAG: hypothetical protein ICV81_14240, partial [Flavisolibacter sp.]|nr:hypothetical protein [Flavisolibacter sp.]